MGGTHHTPAIDQTDSSEHTQHTRRDSLANIFMRKEGLLFTEDDETGSFWSLSESGFALFNII